MIFSFGQSEHERIEVDVLRYERTAVEEYWDDNWLDVEIRVQVGGFRGKATATIQTGELVHFLSELKPLYKTLKGSVEFATLEDQLGLKLTGDGKGHVELNGFVVDQVGIGNRLEFHLQIDQSQLRLSISELEQVTTKFPVRSVETKS